jgi:hypothetical protein
MVFGLFENYHARSNPLPHAFRRTSVPEGLELREQNNVAAYEARRERRVDLLCSAGSLLVAGLTGYVAYRLGPDAATEFLFAEGLLITGGVVGAAKFAKDAYQRR